MSERKVLNKYIPPNFDPEKIRKLKGPARPSQHIVRLMAPFSMRCGSCGEYVYKGRKFNARKETVVGEEYLGIKIFRFYIRCPMCAAEITFKTDPKNSDYTAEHGATRNFEPWREEETSRTLRDKMREEEELANPMKALENKSLDSRKEMELMDALDDIRALNARAQKVDQEVLLTRIQEQASLEELQEIQKRQREEEEDDLAVQELLAAKKTHAPLPHPDESQSIIESEPPKFNREAVQVNGASSFRSANKPVMQRKPLTAASLGIVIKKKQPPT